MGRRDPERQQAIKAALAEMEPTAKEEFAEFIESCENEDSQAIMNNNEFQDLVNRIDAENKRLDITPAEWFSSLQWPSTEEYMIRDALTERWETEMMGSQIDDDHDCSECMEIDAHDDGINWNSSTGQIEFDYSTDDRPEPPDAYEDPSSEIWKPMEFLDDWSGPTIPMSAIENPREEIMSNPQNDQTVENPETEPRSGDLNGSERLMHDILFGESDDPKCDTCRMTVIGCAMAGCGHYENSDYPSS
jgi:hypothetical protein